MHTQINNLTKVQWRLSTALDYARQAFRQSVQNKKQYNNYGQDCRTWVTYMSQ